MSAKISEAEFKKALDEMEALAVKKADALLAADPEGSLATEGEALSGKSKSAKKSKAKKPSMAKMMSASDKSSDDDSSSDDGSSAKKAAACSDDSSSDDGSSGDRMSKGLSDRVGDNDAMRKGYHANEFLENMVDEIDATVVDFRKSIVKHVDRRVDGLEAGRRDFDVRLAKAVVSIGNRVDQLYAMVGEMKGGLAKALSQPAAAGRPNVLSKSDIAQPQLGGSDPDPLALVPPTKVRDWLYDKLDKGEIDDLELTKWEGARWNPRALSDAVQKALAHDLGAA